MMAVNAAVTLGASAADQGRARHRQDAAREEIARALGAAAVRVAHQVDEQGAAGPVRIRRRLAPARFAARRATRARHRATTSSRASSGRRSSRDVQPVLLIDEIDKADIEFPNDLLRELDRMEFYVYETRELVQGAAPARSSSSPATTRRSCRTRSCAAASSTTSAFPDAETMERIVDVHYPGPEARSCWPKRSARSSRCARCRA